MTIITSDIHGQRNWNELDKRESGRELSGVSENEVRLEWKWSYLFARQTTMQHSSLLKVGPS